MIVNLSDNITIRWTLPKTFVSWSCCS